MEGALNKVSHRKTKILFDNFKLRIQEGERRITDSIWYKKNIKRKKIKENFFF